jgi:hypothetical protein
MSTTGRFDFIGPGRTRQEYFDILAAGGETGWWDEHGMPAPWPEDFLDPDSGWQPTAGTHVTDTSILCHEIEYDRTDARQGNRLNDGGSGLGQALA